MKKIVLGLAATVAYTLSVPASAFHVCNGGAAGDGQQVTTGQFVKVAFTPKCSANVFLDGVDNSSTIYAVGSGSAKGKKYFTGNTAGGAVKAAGDCEAGGCVIGDAEKGSAQGVSEAGGSAASAPAD